MKIRHRAPGQRIEGCDTGGTNAVLTSRCDQITLATIQPWRPDNHGNSGRVRALRCNSCGIGLFSGTKDLLTRG